MTDDVGSRIEDVWLEDVVLEATVRPATLAWLFAIAVALHGPIDVLLTAAAWSLEGNVTVQQLGLWPWIAIKVGAIALATFVWYDAPRISPDRYSIRAAGFLGALIGLGVALILPNAAILVVEVIP